MRIDYDRSLVHSCRYSHLDQHRIVLELKRDHERNLNRWSSVRSELIPTKTVKCVECVTKILCLDPVRVAVKRLGVVGWTLDFKYILLTTVIIESTINTTVENFIPKFESFSCDCVKPIYSEAANMSTCKGVKFVLDEQFGLAPCFSKIRTQLR